MDSAAFQDQFTASLHLRNAGMYTLGSWAAGNLLVGGIGYFQSSGHWQRFHEFNVAWNTVNLGLAIAGLYQTRQLDPTGMSLQAMAASQIRTEKILLFNAGLDVGYVATGFYLLERSKNSIKHGARLKGYGRSLILQGAFLFAFDALLYYLMNRTLNPSGYLLNKN